MYSKVNVADVDPMDAPVEGNDATVLPVGYLIDTEHMRPNVWRYEAGESTSIHRHEEQEELFYVLEGRLTLEIGEDPDELEAVEVSEGDVFVIPNEPWRRLTAEEPSEVFAIGSPAVMGDHELLDD